MQDGETIDKKLIQQILEDHEAVTNQSNKRQSEAKVDSHPYKDKEWKQKLLADYKRRKLSCNDILEKLELQMKREKISEVTEE